MSLVTRVGSRSQYKASPGEPRASEDGDCATDYRDLSEILGQIFALNNMWLPYLPSLFFQQQKTKRKKACK